MQINDVLNFNLKKLHKGMQSNFENFVKWVALALAVGLVAGAVSVSFHFAVDIATRARGENPWLIYLLPLGGIFIVWLYRFADMDDDKGANFVLVVIRQSGKIRLRATPLIYLSTVITHLLGGSSGREGAAVQIGGSVASKLGSVLGIDEYDGRIITMCGMSAAFAALFGTPVTAVVFALEVSSVGNMFYSAIAPCCVSATTAMLVASSFGAEPTSFTLGFLPKLTAGSVGRVMLVGVACALVSILFCVAMGAFAKLYMKIKSKTLRIVVGGVSVIALTLIVGNTDYNGAGMDVVERAIYGDVAPYAFLLKILFTAVTLGAGFKGGEIVPTFFTGATFGNFIGGLTGLSSGFGAAVGIAAVFCGVTNCPISSIILSVELFGGEGIIFFAVACGISYALSGYFGLYSEQKIVYSKTEMKLIDQKAKH